MSFFPKIDLDRHDDRDFATTNLVESYERIMAFIARHLPDPFYLEREYMNALPAKLIIERGQVRTENSNKPHGFGLINPETFSPFPKKPLITRFFKEIGQADKLGSGVHKLTKIRESLWGE
jgi:ATP-dependent DNA helicase RecG